MLFGNIWYVNIKYLKHIFNKYVDLVIALNVLDNLSAHGYWVFKCINNFKIRLSKSMLLWIFMILFQFSLSTSSIIGNLFNYMDCLLFCILYKMLFLDSYFNLKKLNKLKNFNQIFILINVFLCNFVT